MLGILRNLLPGRPPPAVPMPAPVAADAGIGAAIGAIHRGRAADAVPLLNAVLARAPADGQAWLWLARALAACHRSDEADDAYDEAAGLESVPAQCALIRGESARQRGDHAEALVHLLRADLLRPGDPETAVQLALALEADGRVTEAEQRLRAELAAHPRSPLLFHHLAALVLRHRGFAAAAACHEEALRALPDDAVARYNYAVVAAEHGRHARAAELYREALARDPGLDVARLNLAATLLQTGELRESGELWEARWDIAPELRGNYRFDPRRQWRGEPLAGRRLLLWAEQGLGDSLAMIRYAPLLKERGAASVHVQVQPALLPLFDGMPGVDTWSAFAAQAEAGDFDLHCPLMSLPYCFGTTLEDIPAGLPYLRAPADRVRRWRERLGAPRAGLRIGLVWSSGVWNDEHFGRQRQAKSVPLAQCAALARIPDAEWISLQLGPGRDELGDAPPGLALADPAAGIADFADTAAIVELLDLVVSIDTSVSHLVAAMNKPVVTLLKFSGGPFWLSGRDDSPWYPVTQRVARQPAPGDWPGALERAAALVGQFRQFRSLWSP